MSCKAQVLLQVPVYFIFTDTVNSHDIVSRMSTMARSCLLQDGRN